MRRKGFVTDIWWTVALLILVVILITVIFLYLVVTKYSDKNIISSSVTFLQFNNDPYNIAEGISNVDIGDRLFTEHMLEAMVVGSLEKSQSQEALTIENYLDIYADPSFDVLKYMVVLKNDEKDLMKVGRLEEFCGTNLEGMCGYSTYNEKAGRCGVGRIEISEDEIPEDRRCDKWLDGRCCREARNELEYIRSGGQYKIVSCGDGSICSTGSTGRPVGSLIDQLRGITFTEFICEPGRIRVRTGDAECKTNANIENGKSQTPVCCRKMIQADYIRLGKVGLAQMPLLYRENKLGYLEVATQ